MTQCVAKDGAPQHKIFGAIACENLRSEVITSFMQPAHVVTHAIVLCAQGKASSSYTVTQLGAASLDSNAGNDTLSIAIDVMTSDL